MSFYSYRTIIGESFLPLSLLLAVTIAAGHVLNSAGATFLTTPFLLILVPVVNGIGGNVGTVLGSRITSGLYTGTISPRLRDEELLRNVRDGAIVYALTSVVLGIFIYGLAPLSGVVPPFGVEVLLYIMLSTGLMLAGVLILVTLSVAFLAFSKGLDPDNFVTPVVTATGDFLGIAFLVVIIGVVL